MRLALLRSFVAIVVLIVPLAGLYRWQAGQAVRLSSERQAVGTLSGEADLERDGSRQRAGKANVYVGDTVQAVQYARLAFGEGTVLDLDPGAQVMVKDVRLGDGVVTVVHKAGRLYVETANPRFRLESEATTLTVEKARFRVDIGANGDTIVVAERGMVYSASGEETVAVAAGESLRTGVGQRTRLQPATPIALPPPPPPPPRTPTPTLTPVPPTMPPQRVHIITQGDTLSYLATKYNTTVEAIIKANNIEDPNMLSIGQKLIIP